MKYAEIIIPQKTIGTQETLTYKIPDELLFAQTPQNLSSNPLSSLLGKIVEIPLRKSTKRGVIYHIHEQQPSYKTKSIIKIVDHAPHLHSLQLELIKFISDYYFCPLYKTIKLFVPSTFFTRKKIALPPPTSDESISDFRTFNLSEEQKMALEKISQSQNNTIVLHGITGSGKTEIYRRLTKEVLAKNEQILILVPEISLTPQTVANFKKQFGNNIAIIHSKISAKKKQDYWSMISESSVQIIIGSRSAIFAPYQKLGMVIIDEEHEDSYKQEQNPRYDTRKVAEKISELLNIKVILGSATPSLESYYKAKQNEYTLITLKERIQHKNQTKLPDIKIVDLREELKKHNFSIFSEVLMSKMKEKLEKKQQILLFLNRRGAASAVICRECGFNIKCPDCDIALTYHRKLNFEHQIYNAERLICHHCGKISKVPTNCPQCKGVYIKYIGIGTQKIEEEIAKVFPEAKILRADRDTVKDEEDFKSIFNDFKEHKADILIGTQMIAKGLHLPKVNLVGVILADLSLTIPDFRSSEKTFQLLTQVSGRSGRESDEGEVIVQTYMPEHYAIQATTRHDYENFYEQELKIRHEHQCSPFNKMIKLTLADTDKERSFYKVQALMKELKSRHELTPDDAVESIYAYPALIPKLKNLYRWHILISGQNPRQFLKNFPSVFDDKNGIKIDVDPIRTV